MLHKYCPNCASLRINPLNDGAEYKCGCCDYQGEVKEDSIEKINDIKKILQNNNNENNFIENINTKEEIEKTNIKEKIKKLSEDSKDFELL